MKTRIAAIAAAAVLTVLLTGCGAAAPAANAPAATDAGVQQVPETPEPLVAETSAAAEPDDVEVAFLEKFREVRATMPGESQIPDATEEQLLAAGREGCERVTAGESTEQMSFIDGETKNGAGYFSDSGALITAARQTLCPAD